MSQRRHSARRTSVGIEQLEERNQPSTVTIDDTIIVYTANDGVANQVWIGPDLMDPIKLNIVESNEDITSVPAGWTISMDKHTATGPFAGKTSIRVLAKDEDDHISGAMSPLGLALVGSNGDDTLIGSDYDDLIYGGDD